MLKLLGSVCILSAGFLLRTFRVQENRQEIFALRDILAALEQMEAEIRLNRTPLPRMLPRLAEGRREDVRTFFQVVAEALHQGEPLPSAWRSAAVNLPISIGGQARVAELGEKLGGDTEKICNGILLASNSLEKELSERLSGQADFEKRSTAVCLSGAALLAILLI